VGTNLSVFDPSAVLLNSITTVLGLILAWICWRIGEKTGFVCFWRKIMWGFIVISIARVILAFGEAAVLSNPDWLFDLRDLGLTTVVIAVLLLIWGFWGFLKEMERGKIEIEVKTNGN
jgi:hypothetical protein